MFKFSKTSQAKIDGEASEDLKLLLNRYITVTYLDFGVTEIFRGEAAQNRAYYAGKSDKKFPDGEHNKIPSNAADLIAYSNGQRTYNMNYYLMLAGGLLATFKQLQYEGLISKDKYLRWGGDWDGDTELLTDQGLDDGMHFEIRKIKK